MRLNILANTASQIVTPISPKSANCHIVYVQKPSMRTLNPCVLLPNFTLSL
jgi:hypothetical protein